MAVEARLSSVIAKWLRQKGLYVLVTTPGRGIPDGCPDIVALMDGGGWITLEVKEATPYRRDGVAKKGAFQPLQQITISKLHEMYYSKVVYPDNWPEIRDELAEMI